MSTRSRGLLAFAVLAVAVFVFFAVDYIGLSQLSAKSQQLVDLKLQNNTANDQLSSLAAAKKQILKYSYFNDVVKTVLPNDKDQAQAVLDISQMAKDSGIALQNIQFPTSNLGGASPAAPASGSSSSSNTTAPSTPATGTAGANTALTQAKKVTGIPGLYSLQLTITPQTGATVPAAQVSTYPKLLDFLNRIEHDRRTAQITQVNVSPQPDGSLSFTLVINIFIKP